MDPLSAIGLAGNIVQFVQFSCSLVSQTSAIYSSSTGQLQSHIELDVIAADLSRLCTNIRNGLSEQSDTQLGILASLCQKIADDLTAIVAKLKRNEGGNKKWQSFRQALKATINAKEVEQLSCRIEQLRSQMNTHMISVVWYAVPFVSVYDYR